MSSTWRLTITVSAGVLAAYICYRVCEHSCADGHGSAEQEADDDPEERRSAEVEPVAGQRGVRETAGQIAVYYGSQTGTAERLARALALRLSEWNSAFQPNANWEEERIAQPGTIAIFAVATHDDGLFPDNATNFVKWLRRLGKDGRSLTGLSFCIFGLGSSEYLLFNQAAKSLQLLLKKLGAHELLRMALGDDTGDLKSDFDQWTVSLCDVLARELRIPPMPVESVPKAPCVKLGDSWRDRVPLELRYVSGDAVRQHDPPSNANVVCKQQWQCTDHVVQDNFNMTPEGNTQTNCVVVEPKSGFSAAETANVLYANPPEVVQYFMEKLNISEAALGKMITFVPRYGARDTAMEFEPPFPVPCTLGDALCYYLDLTGLPSVEVLRDMGTFLKTNEACQWFNKLFQHKELYKRMREELYVTLPEFVELFMADAQLNIGGFLQIVPKKVPKAYTISSHPSSGEIALTVRRVQFYTHTFKDFRHSLKKQLGYNETLRTRKLMFEARIYKGSCTRYLCSLQKGDVVKLYRRPSAFSQVEGLNEKRVVMIANGAGIAPFRALWQDSSATADRVLFLGFRGPEYVLYADELERIKSQPNYTVHIAYSRTNKPMYVQHLLQKHVEEVRAVLDSGGVLCVCGGKPMGAQVKAIVQHFMGCEIEDLKAKGQYIEELW
ncbi:flavodoxin-like protein [Babesia caballi]|uniref:NADPH--hemoprotein reductase n=1 Tax=Babesia caballi TaxID=5871 RepID=A0AAV4LWC1_BABCB|nr:flavodoxin-like protein [Babesia caballi]